MCVNIDLDKVFQVVKMANYKSVLVKNNTEDCDVTLYFYHRHDPVCLISLSSKILKPGSSYLYRREEGYQFQIKTICQNSMNTVVRARQWVRDTHFTIKDRICVAERKLEDHAFEKNICIRKLNIANEASLDERRNLYEILKLNFDEIVKLDKDEQDKEIKSAFHKEIRNWHSDTAGQLGNDEKVHEVIAAYAILKNRKERADYHNKANYSKGWLSRAKWKSVFWSECETAEQKTSYRKRMVMFALSVGVCLGGLILTLATAGAAAPGVVAACGTIGAGCFGGGVQSTIRTTKRESIEKEFDLKDYAKSFGFGFVAGAVTGGAGVGITSGILGIGSVASLASANTAGQIIGVGAGSASVGGAVFSLAADAEKKFVDGVDVTLKQVVGHAVVGAVIGGVTGSAVGAVSGALSSLSAEVTATNIEGKLVPGLRKYGVSMAKSLAKDVTKKSIESVLETLSGFIEERCDDDQENRHISEHLKVKGKQLVSSVLIDSALSIGMTTVGHALDELKVNTQVGKAESIKVNSLDGEIDVDRLNKNTPYDNIQGKNDSCRSDSNVDFQNLDISSMTDQQRRQKIRCDLDRIKRLKWTNATVEATYNPPQQSVERTNVISMTDDIPDIPFTTARFMFLSKGLWKSKMIIEYKTSDGQQTKITNSKNAIEIPIDANEIKVYFKVMRFINTWCDVKKWDRFERKWYDEPHIFKYQFSPEERRFTLDGSLYYEGVIHITNERDDDCNDM